MPNSQTSLVKKKLRAWGIGSITLLLLIIAVEQLIGWQAVIDQWRKLSLANLLVCLFFFCLSYLTRARRIFLLCQPEVGSSFALVTKLSVLHTFTNNILPMRLGEATFPILMKRYYGAGVIKSLARLFWLRVLDALIALGLAGIVFAIYFPMIALLGATLVLATSLIIWITQRKNLSKLLSKQPSQSAQQPAASFIQKVILKAQSTLQHIAQAAPSTHALRNRLIAYTLVSWLCKISALTWLVFCLSGLDLLAVAGAVIGAEMSVLSPVQGIAGAGSFEAAFMVGLSPSGHANANALSLAVNLHVFVLAGSALFAMAALAIKPNSMKPSNSIENIDEHPTK
ncbi:MAG: lysylphosphatidylglycerol synthase transmembrane domain-containing protein [Pontibacterium sp.]